MAQTNYTPISLYYSTTASAVPTAANLVPGELAINTADGKLYYEDSSGVVQVLATKSTGSIGGSNTQVQFNNSGSLGGSSGLTWDGSFLTTSSIKNSALTSGRVTFAGASGLLSDSANLLWSGTQLNVVGTVKSTNSTNTIGQTADVLLSLNNTNFGQTNSATLQTVLNNTTTGANDFFIKQFNHNIGSTTDIVFRANSGTSGYVSLYTNNTEGLRLTPTSLYTASGVNVGIGTSSPTNPLHIVSNTVSQLNVSALSGNTNAQINLEPTGTGIALIGPASSFPLAFRTNATERMRIDSSGNLGIGVTPSAWETTSGSRAIQFTGSAVYGYRDTNLILTQNAYFDGGFKYYASSIASAYYGIGSGVHSWYNAASGTAGNAITFTQAMTLDASGNLLVGTTVTDPITSVVSGVTVTPSTTCFRVYSAVSNACAIGVSSTSSALINFYYNGANFVGGITTNGTITVYGSASDYRLKENIVPMTGALSTIAQLKPVNYKWKSDGSDGQGFIAHELAEVVPNCVNGEKDAIDEDGNIKPQSVDTSFLVATLVSAIQEQQVLIESLTTRLTALENK